MSVRTSIAAVLVALVFAGQAQALELGVQDDGQLRTEAAAVFESGHEIGAQWVRIIIVPRDPTAAAKIRAAHAEGFRVLLTIGGLGTSDATPSAASLRSTIRRLPRAERYTIINEPDLLNLTACDYTRRWKVVRRLVGRRLLWGDYSPLRPLTHLQAAKARCGLTAKRLDVALHPYQQTDPLAPPARGDWWQGGIGNLRHGARWLRRNTGVQVTWWLTEFAYIYDGPSSVTDEQAAAMWPRAIIAAKRAGAKMLGVYMPRGPTWDSRPRALSWCVLAKRCAAPTPDALPFSDGGEVPAYGA